MQPIEGIDYSHGGPLTAAQIKRAGKLMVGRYLVNDLSPSGRGISGAEYANLKAGNVDVFCYWEGEAAGMLQGYAAGVAAAHNAQNNLADAAMPLTMPIHFAHDIDPEASQWPAIDAYLNGAASVIGWDRVGVYGGWLLIEYMASGGNVHFLCQTSAWEYGRGIHPAATLYQYDYNVYINGVNCDLVRALVPNYGQSSQFVEKPPVSNPEPDVVYAKAAKLPAKSWKLIPYTHELTVIKPYQPRAVASIHGAPTGAEVPVKDAKTGKSTVVKPKLLMTADDGSLWFITGGNSRHPAWAFFPDPK